MHQSCPRAAYSAPRQLVCALSDSGVVWLSAKGQLHCSDFGEVFFFLTVAAVGAESRQQMLEKEQKLETNVAALAERIEDDQVRRLRVGAPQPSQ